MSAAITAGSQVFPDRQIRGLHFTTLSYDIVQLTHSGRFPRERANAVWPSHGFSLHTEA